MATTIWGNQILSELSADDMSLLLPLQPVELRQGDRILRPGEPIEQVIFPHSGVISLIVTMRDGSAVEAAMIGREGALGTSAISGLGQAINGATVQVPGKAYSVPLGTFVDALGQSRSLQDRMSRFNSVLLAQAQQAAACNASHSAQARVCRWLLELRDRCESDLLPLTQGYLAHMVGVQRTTVTLVASRLQAMGAIRCRRGKIRVLDSAKLENATCECYGRMRSLLNRVPPVRAPERTMPLVAVGSSAHMLRHQPHHGPAE